MSEHGLPLGRKESRLDPVMGELVRMRAPLIVEARDIVSRAIYLADPRAYHEVEQAMMQEVSVVPATSEALPVAGATAIQASMQDMAENLLTAEADPQIPEYLDELASADSDMPIETVPSNDDPDSRSSYELAA